MGRAVEAGPERIRCQALLALSSGLGEAHLRSVLAEYQAHYNNGAHQGIAQRIPAGERDAC